MNPRLRNVLAVVAGLLLGGIVIAVMERANSGIFPPPTGTDFTDPATLERLLLDAPPVALLGVLVAWALGTFVGAFTAAKVGVGPPRVRALVVGSFLLGGAIFNMLTIPHPSWFWVVALLLFHPAALIAAKVAGSGGGEATAA